MITAFATNKETVTRYDPEFVASCYEYPGLDRTLSPAFYDGDKMVAVLGAFPRQVRIDGNDLRLVLLTFNSVHPEYRHLGLGIEMISEAARRARRQGFDGALFSQFGFDIDQWPAGMRDEYKRFTSLEPVLGKN